VPVPGGVFLLLLTALILIAAAGFVKNRLLRFLSAGLVVSILLVVFIRLGLVSMGI